MKARTMELKKALASIASAHDSPSRSHPNGHSTTDSESTVSANLTGDIMALNTTVAESGLEYCSTTAFNANTPKDSDYFFPR